MIHQKPISGLLEELKDKEFRDAYVFEHVCAGLPFQIRDLRKQRGWNQTQLAEAAGKTQSMISEIEGEDEGRFQLRTLMDMASAFDVALLVKFVPYSRFLKEVRDVSPRALQAESFEKELPSLSSSDESPAPNYSIASHSVAEGAKAPRFNKVPSPGAEIVDVASLDATQKTLKLRVRSQPAFDRFYQLEAAQS